MSERSSGVVEKRIESFSRIRTAGCLAIIVLHSVFSGYLVFQEGLSPIRVFVSNGIANLLMWGVPCFLMVSGALLLDPERKITLKKIYSVYILRMVKALLFCSVVFAVVDLCMKHERFTPAYAGETVMKLLTGGGWSHLWYLYLMIGLYILLPVFRMISEHSTKEELRYILTLFFVFLSILPLLAKFGITINVYFAIATIYPFYFLMGYALRKDVVVCSKKVWIILLAVSSAAILILTWLRWQNGWVELETCWSYSSPLVVIQAMCVYRLYLEAKTIRSEKMKNIVCHLDSCSFGIYLFHMIWIRVMLRTFGFNPYRIPVLGTLTVIVTAFVFGYVVTYVLKKVLKLKFL